MDRPQAFINSLALKEFFDDGLNQLNAYAASVDFTDIQTGLTAAATSFALILAAEMGDKSQLVCMALAAKHRPVPVILGALSAFALLNALAVVFGNVIAHWLPDYIIALAVAFLFTVFGVQALRTVIEDDDQNIRTKSGYGIFLTTFLLITVAEFGDKTQLAVVALSSTNSPSGVWLGATGALATTSALGVLAGRKLLQRIPLELLHKIGGVIFLLLAGFALTRAYHAYVGM
ncbi:MAG: TMEM165/GDT1 family protein [Gammaproteobacteria bacterium]|nr:TMEM165/GDT1 family protein [Gammaproteobacteria bacterium]